MLVGLCSGLRGRGVSGGRRILLAVCQQEDPGQGQDWIYVLMIHLPEKMEFIVFLLPVGDGMQKTGRIKVVLPACSVKKIALGL